MSFNKKLFSFRRKHSVCATQKKEKTQGDPIIEHCKRWTDRYKWSRTEGKGTEE